MNSTASRRGVCREGSRWTVELFRRGFAKNTPATLQRRIGLVQEGAEGRTRTRVAEEPLPGAVAIQLGQQRREIGDQFAPLRRGESEDGGLDFLHRTHEGRLACHRRLDKPCLTRTWGRGGANGQELAVNR
jgi:hypothetical protein